MSGENRKLSAIIGVLMNIFAVMYFDAHTHHLQADQHSIMQLASNKIPKGFFSVGIHPWTSNNWETQFSNIKLFITHPKCIAIGEAGLDKHHTRALKNQFASFEAQIVLSEELELPLILHCVKAWPEIHQIRKSFKPKQKWIYHGYSKSELVDQVLQEDMLISFGKALFTNHKLSRALKSIPKDRLLFETDNSGLPIDQIYLKAAELMHMEEGDLGEQIASNFKQTFRKWNIG
jgi:TatD DNase family protein